MKKLFIIILMLTYGLSSSGMSVSLHYCCGKLDGISFSGRHSKGCAKNNEIKKSRCCNDKQISLKVHTDQEPVAKWIQAYKSIIALPLSKPALTSFTRQYITVDKLARGTPPLLSPVSLFIKNCVFRI